MDNPQNNRNHNNLGCISQEKYFELFDQYKKNSKIKQGLYESIMKVLAPENAKLIQ